jgi:hypothetical protein
MKIKLNLDALSVESFETDNDARDGRGTVHAHDADPTRTCNTRQPFCLMPSVNQPCITDPVECG